jgi:predicted TPR repeat methyltransferase
MDNKIYYDESYYENGVLTGKSCYVNYRWMPELTIKMAYSIIKYLNIGANDSILDFGCAKGYIVKSLRILDVNAFGCDISEYAIKSVDPDIREYCYLVKNDIFEDGKKYNWLMTKDVLEHMNESDIDKLLSQSVKNVKSMFHVIPLGNDGNFIVPEYHDDPSHIQIQSKDWWIAKFKEHGWNTVNFDYKVNGIKDNWTEKYEFGNGYFTLSNSNKDLQ